MKNFRKAFTLIELLVVIAIIAVLAVVVILVLNPAELLRQARDSNRLSDMSTIMSAISLYTEDTNKTAGVASTTYVSIADQTATSTAGDQCQALGLTALSSGYQYHCGASSTFRNVDGNGWIPANWKSISFSSPLSAIPIDPINTTSSGLYYTYGTDGKYFELTWAMESTKYSVLCANDNGQYADLCEIGTNPFIAPIDYYGNRNGWISFNTPVTVSTTANATVVYNFNGAAGQAFNFVANTLNDHGGCMVIGILKPDGSTLSSNIACGPSTSFNNVILSTAGTYMVYLNPNGNPASGILWLVNNITGTLSLNTPLTASSSYPAQYIAYTFSGTASTSVSLSITGINNHGGCPTGGITTPSGTTLVSGSTCGSTITLNNNVLPTTGTYTAFLNPSDSPISGTFTLTSP